MRRVRLTALTSCALVLAAFALAGLGPSASGPDDPAVGAILRAERTAAGGRVVVGTVPAVATHLRVTTAAGVSDLVATGDPVPGHPALRRVRVAIGSTGTWRVEALWGEHVVGAAQGVSGTQARSAD